MLHVFNLINLTYCKYIPHLVLIASQFFHFINRYSPHTLIYFLFHFTLQIKSWRDTFRFADGVFQVEYLYIGLIGQGTWFTLTSSWNKKTQKAEDFGNR